MENNCKYVCSRGLLKSTTFHSNNPKSSCSNDYGYLQNMLDGNKMFNGMSIYVCSDLLLFFTKNILTKLTHSFYLLSGDSDLTVPNNCFDSEESFLFLLNHPLLIRWFSQNNIISNHPKIVQMPIGLDYHTILNNPNFMWRTPGEGYLPVDQECILNGIIETSVPFSSRNVVKIYVNFNMKNDRFKDRISVFNEIHKDLLSIYNDFIPRTENWRNISTHAFVLSPSGMGLDCHRTWEALVLGAIPIIRTSQFSQMFEGLPVLVVNQWSDITLELLEKTVADFNTRTFNYDKYTLTFWTSQFK